MHTENVTTPFGRRPMSLGMLATQLHAADLPGNASVDKWKLYRALCEARARLGVTDRALALLNALLSFHPHAELAAGQSLVVFPSNAQLSLRANGMAEATIRRHLAVLVEAGLIARKDSANGKRFARRGQEGVLSDAFGFSLAPLLARCAEIERLAADATAERLHLQRLRERLSIARRDLSKLIATALEEGLCGTGEGLQADYQAIMDTLPRRADATTMERVLSAVEALRERVINMLEKKINLEIKSASPAQIERHIQNSNTESPLESEPLSNEARDEPAARKKEAVKPELRAYPLGLVLQACPEIMPYGPAGQVGSWRDLMTAAVVVRSMLGVSPSAYEAACAAMGPENAAAVMACILERAGHINSAGGYLRNLTEKAEKGEFSLGPMLMALARGHMPAARRAG